MTYLRAFTSPIFRRRSFIFEVTKRYFLSNAFECKETWNSRLERPIFKKINYENMYYDLDNQYKRSRTLIPIDIDIYVNGQTDDSFLTEVEEMVYLLRTTGLTHLTLPTTHHAFVRLFLEYKKNDLVRILHDRLNYGIFPDDYLICYLIDKFVKAEDFRNAAKVATLQMFQEDYSHELGKYLSLYAIHRYLLTNEPWDDIVEETKTGEEEEEEEEEVKVRVSYLRNPYFDDHFDLTDGQHICGKSLVMISKTLDNIALNNSYKIMGLALYNKWKKLEVELTRLVDQQKKLSEPILYQDALNFSTQIINDKLKDESLSSEIQKLLRQIEEKHCSKNNLLLDVENLVKETVKLKEASEISAQEKLYKEWEILRENELDAHLKEVQRQNRLKEIQRRKNEMIEKEQLLYFFDNEDEINVICEKKEKILSKRNRQSAEESEKEYVPPEIQKRVSE